MNKIRNHAYFPIQIQKVHVRFDVKTNRMAFFNSKEFLKIHESLECNQLKFEFDYEYDKYFKKIFSSEKAMKRYILKHCDFYGDVTLYYIKKTKSVDKIKKFKVKKNASLTKPDLGVLPKEMEELFKYYRFRNISRFHFYEQTDYPYTFTKTIFRITDIFGNIFNVNHDILKDINLPMKDRMFFIGQRVKYFNKKGITLEKDGNTWVVKGSEISKTIEKYVSENNE